MMWIQIVPVHLPSSTLLILPERNDSINASECAGKKMRRSYPPSFSSNSTTKYDKEVLYFEIVFCTTNPKFIKIFIKINYFISSKSFHTSKMNRNRKVPSTFPTSRHFNRQKTALYLFPQKFFYRLWLGNFCCCQ